MSKSIIEIQPGTVDRFNPETGKGLVNFPDSSQTLEFKSIDFRSGRPTRFPRTGEKVEVVLAKGAMITIRSVRE